MGLVAPLPPWAEARLRDFLVWMVYCKGSYWPKNRSSEIYNPNKNRFSFSSPDGYTMILDFSFHFFLFPLFILRQFGLARQGLSGLENTPCKRTANCRKG